MIEQVRFNEKIMGVLAAFLIYAIVLVPNSFAHNIDLDKAWEIARSYARVVRKESPRKYLHYATNCVNAYPGHNHFVRCIVQFQNERDNKAGVWTCTETVQLSHQPHKGGRMDYSIGVQSTSSNTCGIRRISQLSADELGL